MDKFIHVFLAFARATPQELGVDDAVTLAPIDPDAEVGTAAADQCYIYRCPIEGHTVDSPKYKYFKTVHIIKEMRPYNISGRNTRVWKVVEVTGPDTNEVVTGDELVLKDVWLDKNRKTEAQNLDAIFAAVENLCQTSQEKWGPNWKETLFSKDKRFSEFDDATKLGLQELLVNQKYKSLFLTKLHAWQGETSRAVGGGAMYSPEGKNIFGEDPDEVSGLQSQSASRTVPGFSLFSASPQAPANNLRQYAPKTQSRFVYKEVCCNLDTVGTLGTVMNLINQALKGTQRLYMSFCFTHPQSTALQILFCAGWVHRDISSNNLLAYNNNGEWKLKLSDLEFSRALDDGEALADPRTVSTN